ncbi:YdcF family protein [Argonema antarcticum]|uniref:YdcF family protein n=1 Tax=Argonema antarcticum TaxID=2942763 RepID=UPI0020115071|nr:YdcF family protein [Argonema antarcticum A004/B2]
MFEPKLKRFRLICLVSTAFIVLLISIIPVRLALAHLQAPQPQAILTLGGGIEREIFTGEFALGHPTLEIWVSTGTPPEVAAGIFRAYNIPDSRLHIDRRAVDTVTNFTTLIADFKSRQIKHLYVITSAYHMPRAKAIATLILGSQGIAFTPVSIPSGEAPESWQRILRDIGRSLVWIVTGHTGASLDRILEAWR